MTITIAVVSDTHLYTWQEVHPDIRAAVAAADISVHCGDFVRQDVAEGFKRQARRSVLVHGNSDPIELRQSLPYVDVVEIEGIRMGVIHPAWGGPEFEPEALLPDFAEKPDAILFGHLHETMAETRGNVLYVNPGQGYASFMVPATIALVTVENGSISAEIIVIEPAR